MKGAIAGSGYGGAVPQNVIARFKDGQFRVEASARNEGILDSLTWGRRCASTWRTGESIPLDFLTNAVKVMDSYVQTYPGQDDVLAVRAATIASELSSFYEPDEKKRNSMADQLKALARDDARASLSINKKNALAHAVLGPLLYWYIGTPSQPIRQ